MIRETPSGFLLSYGALELPFSIENSKRKSVAISVHPDRSLRVVAPHDADVATVLKRVDGKASWIARQWRAFSPATAQPTRDRHGYFAGETHWYLGRAYRLKLLPLDGAIEANTPIESDGRAGVTLEGRFLWVRAKTREAESEEARAARVERLLTAWYRDRAHEVFDVWLEKCLARTRSLELGATPTWEVRRMEKRWGSCTADGKLMLGLDLIKMPVDCIEYVIFHELCHLQVPHHGPEFYRLLGRFLPDWKERKSKLEEWGEKI